MRILTTDIYEGAYLLSQGAVLDNIWLDQNKPNRSVIFEFMGEDVLVLRKKYQKGQASANVLRLKTSLNELKDRMFSLLRENRLRGEKNEIHRKRAYIAQG
ncbi:MAG: hypothetical protein KAI43_09135 [Candidatus Aureabacteria bacterium]|nr:hypothetical protein [Candidatus Auribacterota bacterium]